MKNNLNGGMNWKTQQIEIFKQYIKNFKPGSIEHAKISNGINALEKSM